MNSKLSKTSIDLHLVDIHKRLDQINARSDWEEIRNLAEKELDKLLKITDIPNNGNFLTAEILAYIHAFQKLSKGEREQIIPLLEYQYYKADEVIVSQNSQRNNHIYFVVSGSLLAIYPLKSDEKVILGSIGSGEMFGELSAIDKRPRSASVVAVTDALICSVSADNFRVLRRTYPDVAEATLEQMAKTLRRSSERLLKITSESRDPRIRKTLSYFAAKQEQLDVA